MLAEALVYAALLPRRCWRPRNFKTHRAVFRRKKYWTSYDDTVAETLFETDVETIGDTIENGKSEELTHTLTYTLEKAQTGNLSDRLAN